MIHLDLARPQALRLVCTALSPGPQACVHSPLPRPPGLCAQPLKVQWHHTGTSPMFHICSYV